MILVVGGLGQGKLEYVLGRTGHGPEEVAYTPEEAETQPVFYGLERWPELDVDRLLQVNPGIVLICQEVGCGVVPVEPEERAWREAAGRLCCRLAQRAECVIRIFCGLPLVLKGDMIWN